jgi:hypothetical protein
MSATTLAMLKLADDNPGWGTAALAGLLNITRAAACMILHRYRKGRVVAILLDGSGLVARVMSPGPVEPVVMLPAGRDQLSFMLPCR